MHALVQESTVCLGLSSNTLMQICLAGRDRGFLDSLWMHSLRVARHTADDTSVEEVLGLER